MKKLILTVLFVSVCSVCFGATYIIYNPANQEVYSISDLDDAVVPKGFEKVVIKDNMRDLDLIYSGSLYKWNGQRLIPNNKKLDKLAADEEKARDKAEQEKLIQAEIRKQAIERLKAQNITITEE